MADLNDIRQRIPIHTLAEAAGAVFDAHHDRSHCPLPSHLGDRTGQSFVIYDNGRRWKCHSTCPPESSGGDVFSFYMAWRAVDFKTALKELSEWIGDTPSSAHATIPITQAVTTLQPAEWRKRAMEFVLYAEKNMNAATLEYLQKERGLSVETIRAFHVGYNPSNLYDYPVHWGMEGKKIWLPRGIVIPGFWKGKPQYIKIRRPIRDDSLGRFIGKWTVHDGNLDVKFGGPRGGRSTLFRLELTNHLPYLILTEGEWDAMLLWDHCADLCDVATLGGAQSKFELIELAFLTRFQKIFVVHDNDKAGDCGRQYIVSLQAEASRVRSVKPLAHDLTDFWKAGGSLRDRDFDKIDFMVLIPECK